MRFRVTNWTFCRQVLTKIDVNTFEIYSMQNTFRLTLVGFKCKNALG